MTDVMVFGDDWGRVSRASMLLHRSGFTVVSAGPGSDIGALSQTFEPRFVLEMRCPMNDRRAACHSVLYQRLQEVEGAVDDRADALRRVTEIMSAVDRDGIVRVGDLEVDPRGHTARVDGCPVALTPIQFELLLILCEHADQVLSKQQLLELLYRYDGHDPNLIEVHISGLRRQIDHTYAHIETVRSVGYVIRSPRPAHTDPTGASAPPPPQTESPDGEARRTPRTGALMHAEGDRAHPVPQIRRGW